MKHRNEDGVRPTKAGNAGNARALPKADEGLIGAWLDGRLEDEQGAAFEARLERDPDFARRVELAERVDEGLLRQFAGAESGASRALERALAQAGAQRGPVAQGEPARPGADARRPWLARSWPAILVLTAAAVLVAILRMTPQPATILPARPSGDGGDLGALLARGDVDRGDLGASARDRSAASVGPTVGPLEVRDPERELVRVSRPDLESIYDDATYWASDASLSACGTRDDLAGSLLASYGQELELDPGAANLLQGPFGSDQWPTATILAGSAEGATAVLIAERHSMLTCCLDVELEDESDLNVFTWQLGDIVLTEITPLREPHLMGYFSEVR